MTKPDSKSPKHIPEDDIAAFLAHRLSLQRNEEVIAHLAECPRCRTLVTESERSQEFTPDPNGTTN